MAIPKFHWLIGAKAIVDVFRYCRDSVCGLISIIKSYVGYHSPSSCAAEWVRLLLEGTLCFAIVDSLELDVSESDKEVDTSGLESESSELDPDSRVKHVF